MEFNATFIISAISFIVFVFIMNQILYKPMAKIVSEREKYIQDNNDVANNSNIETQNLVDEKEAKTKEANLQAGKIILEQTNLAKENRANMLNEASNSARQRLTLNQQDLKNQKARAIQDVSDTKQDIANLIIKKIMGKEL